jgi:hypothetical protein
MAMKKQTLAAAGRVPAISNALAGLIGKPFGGWGETAQAMGRLREELPWRDERNYTVWQLIDHYLDRDHADRYQLKVPSK